MTASAWRLVDELWSRPEPFWVVGSLTQGVCVAGMAAALWWLDGIAAAVNAEPAAYELHILRHHSGVLWTVDLDDVAGRQIDELTQRHLCVADLRRQVDH